MASKKFTLVLALLGLMQATTFAQTMNDASDAYVFDSSKVSTKHMPQFNEFKNNQYPYPARPKDEWELGGGIGGSFVLGDRAPLVKSYIGGITGNITLRKSLSHVVSIRVGYSGSMVTLPQQKPHYPGSFADGAKNEAHMGSADLLFSLNTLSHYRGNPKTNIYALFGYSLVATRVRTFQTPVGLAAGFHTYYYPTAGLIGTFGSATVNGRHAWGLLHAYDLGVGMSWRLNEKWNIGIEEKLITPISGNDFLDGHSQGNSNDRWSYSTFRVNMNLGTKSGTRTEPLWWINPNNYVYNEVNTPKHMKIPTPVLPDADGDGVTDQFDLEPNTPAGAAVDSHGRAKDTDGDGVPDYKDKEILTPQSCFPVNADGVGTCPEPACCTELRKEMANMMAKPACALTSLPSVTFKARSAKLSKDAQAILSSAAAQINANPDCHVRVVGYETSASKQAQQLAWDRVNAVIKYLVEKGNVAESRIIFSYENPGSTASNTVDLQPTTDNGPNTVPAPHPQYRTTH
ncbi:MAG TPA: OmpA family protein [Chitinophagaceae bacterium]|nr:OmpA family protein [Chitinophagaceae bacterium]